MRLNYLFIVLIILSYIQLTGQVKTNSLPNSTQNDAIQKLIKYSEKVDQTLSPNLFENVNRGNLINVKSEGAQGDGIVDDTEIIQSILDNILKSVLSKGIGGTVYFPPGVYKISKPLKIPPRTVIQGTGSFTQEHSRDANWKHNKNYNKKLSSVIKLAAYSNCNILEPYVDTDTTPEYKPFESVIIERIALDGSRYEQSNNGLNNAGIFMPELSYEVRSGLVLQNVLIFDVNGNGFYAGHRQNEFLLQNVFSRNNSANGFYIGGEDVSMYRVASGENGLYGFYFKDRGAYKCIDLDSWGNKKGVVIENAANGSFFRLQCDINLEEGLFLKGAEDMAFISSVFAGNSNQKNEIFYSEIKLENTNVNGYGPFGIKFIGCSIGSGNISKQTKFGIEETSDKPGNNIIVGTAFKTNEFLVGAVNDKVFKHYSIESCTTGDYGSENFNIGFYTTKNNYFELTPRHNMIFIDGTSDCEIVLPLRSETKLGKKYKILKSSANTELSFLIKENIEIETIRSGDNNSYKNFITASVIFVGDRWVLYEGN